jgi:hypothetical protein
VRDAHRELLWATLVFVAHINDLQPPVPVITIKYVDDTNILHASSDPLDTTLQAAATYLSEWSGQHNMKFNMKKSKELRFYFGKSMQDIPSLHIDGCEIECVSEAKILGVILRDDLKWNSHIDYYSKEGQQETPLDNFMSASKPQTM